MQCVTSQLPQKLQLYNGYFSLIAHIDAVSRADIGKLVMK